MKLHLFVLGLASCITIVLSWRSFKVVFVSLPMTFNKKYADVKVEVFNDTGDPTLNVQVNMIEQIDDVTLDYDISIENTDGNFTRLLNRTVNLCKFYRSRFHDPILKMVFDDLTKYGQIYKRCPVKKGMYYLHDYKVDEEVLPSYLPETNLYVKFAVNLPKKVNVFKGSLNAKIDKTKGFNNLKVFSLG